MKPRQSFFFFLCSLLFTLSSCQRSTAPLPDTKNLQLKVEDVSCTEAWLRLTSSPAYYGKNLKLLRGDSLIISKPLTANDTLLYDRGLWPNSPYTYRARVYDGGRVLSQSPNVTATTLDTTSHDFTWQTYEFGGQGGSSAFYDVSIISPTDIWAVGEIYTADDKYNAAHWDGEKWELKKITYGGWFWTINTVFAFSHNDVWFSAFVKWNGNKVVEYPIPDVLTGYGLNKTWGTSDHDLYIVGNNGLIAHYNGQKWQRIESGTELPIRDIWGSFNFRANTYDIYAIASDEFNSILLKMNGNSVLKYPVPENALEMSGIWFQNNRSFFIVGDGIFTKKRLSDKNWFFYKQGLVTSYASAAVRGEGINDIFVSGGFFELVHFNGLNWHKYDVPFSDDFGVYGNIDIRNNRIILVGYHHQKAIIVMGRR